MHNHLRLNKAHIQIVFKRNSFRPNELFPQQLLIPQYDLQFFTAEFIIGATVLETLLEKGPVGHLGVFQGGRGTDILKGQGREETQFY